MAEKALKNIKCEKSIDGKHKLEKRIITYNETAEPWGRVVSKTPIYADYCIKCNKWGEVYNK